MSVGRTTGRPSPIASTASSTRRSSVDHSLTSREIFPDRDLLVAERRAAGRPRRCALPSATSKASAPPGTRRLSASSAIASVAPDSTSAARGSCSPTSGWSAATSSGATYGGLETTRSNGPSRPANRSPSTSSTRRPVQRDVLRRNGQRVPRRVRSRSRAHPDARPRSPARSRPTRCRRRARRLGAIRDQLEAALDEHLGLGPRDQNARDRRAA